MSNAAMQIEHLSAEAQALLKNIRSMSIEELMRLLAQLRDQSPEDLTDELAEAPALDRRPERAYFLIPGNVETDADTDDPMCWYVYRQVEGESRASCQGSGWEDLEEAQAVAHGLAARFAQNRGMTSEHLQEPPEWLEHSETETERFGCVTSLGARVILVRDETLGPKYEDRAYFVLTLTATGRYGVFRQDKGQEKATLMDSYAARSQAAEAAGHLAEMHSKYTGMALQMKRSLPTWANDERINPQALCALFLDFRTIMVVRGE